MYTIDKEPCAPLTGLSYKLGWQAEDDEAAAPDDQTCKTLHVIAHFNDAGGIGDSTDGGRRMLRNAFVDCVAACNIGELVLYGCWGGNVWSRAAHCCVNVA